MKNINLKNVLDYLGGEEKKASEQWAYGTMEKRKLENELKSLPKVSKEDQKILDSVEARIKRESRKTKSEKKKNEIQTKVLSNLSDKEQESVNKATSKEVVEIKISEEDRRIKTVNINLEQIVKLREEILKFK